MKHTVTFYFDHTPGIEESAIYPFVANKYAQAPLPGWTRYRATVQFDDGAANVESTILDAATPVGVVLTVDGSAAYTFPDR